MRLAHLDLDDLVVLHLSDDEDADGEEAPPPLVNLDDKAKDEALV